MKRKTAILIVLLSSATSFGGVVTIPLPELLGNYSESNVYERRIWIDFSPISFEIGAVSLCLSGNVQPGIVLVDGNEQSRMTVYPGIETTLLNLNDLPPVIDWGAGYTPPPPYESFQFDIEMEYEVATLLGNPSHSYPLSYLADKQMRLSLGVNFGVNTDDILEIGPNMEIAEAELLITPVPEPATVFLLALGSLALTRRRRA